MAWTTGSSFNQGSHLMSKTLIDIFAANYTGASNFPDLNSVSTIKAVLYDNSVTPDSGASSASAGYNGAGSVWTSVGGSTGASQVYQTGASSDWVQGGRTIVSGTAFSSANNASGSLITWAPSLSMANTTATTLSNIYGMFLYFTNTDAGSSGILNSGLGFWWFGGTAYGVTSGTLTVTSSVSGLFTLQV